MTAENDKLNPLLQLIETEARRLAQERREADRILSERLELGAALHRFGISGATASKATAQDDPAALTLAERTHLETRVERELGRLARFARSRDPRYDLNRHILLARLVRWLRGSQAWVRPAPSPADRNGMQRLALSPRPKPRSRERLRKNTGKPTRHRQESGRKNKIGGIARARARWLPR